MITERGNQDRGDIFENIRGGTPSVSEMLYHTLRRGIISGKFAPGEHLVEREISRLADVSRTPIREAFRRLEAEGLVAHHPRRGVEVLGIVPQRVEDVFAVREALQALMAERAALNASAEDLEAMRRSVEEAEALVDHQEGFMLTQDNFNSAFNQAAHTPIAEGFLRQLADYLEEFRARSLWTRERRATAAAEHRAIYEAIAQGNPEAARIAITQHARESMDRVKTVVLSLGRQETF